MSSATLRVRERPQRGDDRVTQLALRDALTLIARPYGGDEGCQTAYTFTLESVSGLWATLHVDPPLDDGMDMVHLHMGDWIEIAMDGEPWVDIYLDEVTGKAPAMDDGEPVAEAARLVQTLGWSAYGLPIGDGVDGVWINDSLGARIFTGYTLHAGEAPVTLAARQWLDLAEAEVVRRGLTDQYLEALARELSGEIYPDVFSSAGLLRRCSGDYEIDTAFLASLVTAPPEARVRAMLAALGG